MLSSIITILLILILSPVILVAGFIALGLITCLIIYTAIAIFILIIEVTEKISEIVQKIKKSVKKKTKQS